MKEQILDSKSNYVRLIRLDERDVIEKHYCLKLKNYSEYWPLSRGEVEAHLLQFLAKRMGEGPVSVPSFISWNCNTHSLYMSRVPGRILAEFSPADLMQDALWQPLFRFIYSLKQISLAELHTEIGSILDEQAPIFDCMMRYKAGGHVPAAMLNAPLSDRVLSLGDFSLNNILWDTAAGSDRIYLIDFESAHWGYIGYDIGQLLAMIDTRLDDSELSAYLTRNLLKWIPDKHYIDAIHIWREQLRAFYEH